MSEKQRRVAAIVGTSHSLQLGLGGDDLGVEFSKLLDAACHKHHIRAIAEEMSADALKENGLAASVGMRLARDRKLPHKLCDPGLAIRSSLGIRGVIEEFHVSLTPRETEARIRAGHKRRERYWLNQLCELDTWPVLFICGANHVSAFSALLRANNIRVSVQAKDWPEK